MKDSAVRLATQVIRDQDEKVRAKVAKGPVCNCPFVLCSVLTFMTLEF